MEHHVTATECHLPYGITQRYLLPDTSERTPASLRHLVFSLSRAMSSFLIQFTTEN